MPKPVSEEYPELMHYTTGAGFTGIVSNGCLWATHAAFLNDAEEIKHFFDVRLLDVTLAEVLKYTNQLARSPAIAKKIKAEGGIAKIAKSEAARDPRVSYSGLLSQWRGYGGDGGYALVLDTVAFERLLMVEGKTYHYQHAEWGDVHYYGVDPSSQLSSQDVAEYEEVVKTGIAKLIRGGTAEETEGFYAAISSLSCRYKHWGFWKEQEVRVVAIPVDAEVARLAAEGGEDKPQKSIKTFLRGGLPVPYLELFGSPGSTETRSRLPIKRVIVGPHREADLRAKAVQRLLETNGYDAEVVCSKIPYIGR